MSLGQRLLSIMVMTLGVITTSVSAPVSAGAESLQPIRDKMAQERRHLIEEHMHMTPEEAKQFWPIYSDFEKEVAEWRQRRALNVGWLGENFDDNFNGDEAFKVVERQIAVEEARLNIYKRGFTRLKSVLPGRKLLLYLQIENKIHAYTEAGIADEIPLINASGTTELPSAGH